jgi:circadian clock protein KaiC
LILNNQIALYKSTGQTFNLVAVKLDPTANAKGLLTINQLQNAIRLSTDKKDKICAVDDKVLVLLVKSSSKNVISLVQEIQSNLPSVEEEYLNTVLNYISIYTIEVDESINDAEYLINNILEAEYQNRNSYTPLTKYNE